MRKAFINTLIQQARQDDSIYLLVADVGFNLVEPFRDEFSDRFINVGIAEQNMIGVAAGLALSGKKVFCYSLGNFPTLRCLEQIRNDICYHNLPVTIVSGGAGLYYGSLGSSHHATEDITIMRALPNMSVINPCDPVHVEMFMEFWDYSPRYLRLQGSNDEECFNKVPLPSDDCITVLMATGSIIREAIEASEILKNEGIEVCVFSQPSIKPLTVDFDNICYKKCKCIFTVEEHNLSGGFGSAVLEAVNDLGLDIKVIRLGLQDKFCKEVGSQQYLRKLNGIDAEGIASKVREVFDGLESPLR